MPKLPRSAREMMIVFAALCALPAGVTPAAAEALRLGVEADVSHETNVNRAALGKEEKSDNAVSVEAYATRSVLLSDRSGLVFRGAVHATEYSTFGDLSSVGISGRGAYRIQPWPGFTTPWLELAGQVDGFKYRDSDVRDGYIASVGASVGQYFTDRIRAEIGVGYDRRGGGAGNLYDLSNRKAWLALDYKLTPKTVFYGSGTWMEGEQVFTVFNTAPWAALYSSAKTKAPDPVFASAFGGAPTAYRMDARTMLYELGVNYALAGNHAIDVGWSHFDSRATHSSGTYDGNTIRAGYLYRFR